MGNMQTPYHSDQSFMQLISDAIFFYKAAIDTKDKFKSQRLVRASILNSALSLEATANCCLYHIDGSKSFINDLEKTTTFVKLDFFAKIRNEKFIDRGCNAYQKVVELKKVRDSFVHPKKIKIPMELSIDEEKYEKFVELGLSFNGNPYPATNIDKSSMFWFHKDAKSALESVFNFYDYYFIDLLNLDQKEILSMLGSMTVVGDQAWLFHPAHLEKDIDYLSEIGIKQKTINLKIIPQMNVLNPE